MKYNIDLMDYCSHHIHASDPHEISRRSMGGFGYHGDTPIGDTWAIMMSYAPNVASLLEDSNWEVITEDMIERFPDDTTIERFSSWLTPTENLMIRMIDDSGVPTLASQAIRDWMEKLDDYPVADEEHYSEKESDAEYDSVEQEMHYLGVHGSVSDVLDWLHEVGQYESIDGYFDSSNIREACIDLGLLESEDNNE